MIKTPSLKNKSSDRFIDNKLKVSSQKNSHLLKLITVLLQLIGKKTKKTFSLILNHLLQSYHQEGLITIEEQKMFINLASLADKRIDNLMVPRFDIIAINYNEKIGNIKKIIMDKGHSRLPVYRENIDEVVGFIHSKDLAQFIGNDDDFSVKKILRKILFVPANIKPVDLMSQMKNSRTHIAIVLDEFGAVDGLITIENIVEEIVGNIEDEHDLPSDNSFFRIKQISQNSFQFGARVDISKLEELLSIKVKSEDDHFQTIGGFTLSIFKRVPAIADEIIIDNLKFKIIDADNRAIKLIEINKL